MINPIVIIITISVILSMLAVCVINKLRKPLMTATMILIFLFYISVTFMIDNAITSTEISEQFGDFIKFLVMSDMPSYDELAESFAAFMKIDIMLVIVTLGAMFTEITLIFRKESRR